MSRRDRPHLRCRACRMHQSLCVCSVLRPIPTRTKLVLVIHRYEARKTTNTGLLATACLSNSEIMMRGHADAPNAIAPPKGSLFLFPYEDAAPITRFVDSPDPITLIVPDGTWRQASKVYKRIPGMRDVPCVSLPPDVPTAYRLRSEPRENGLATIEAIARAMGILEGAHVREALERVFRMMVERTLWSRGALETRDVTGGIPEGVMRHAPLRR